jgi:hypothetical protein
LFPSKKIWRSNNFFLQLLASNSLELMNAISVHAKKQDNTLECVVKVLDAHKRTMPIIQGLIAKEVADTSSPQTLFRGNNAATKLIGTYTRLIGNSTLDYNFYEKI